MRVISAKKRVHVMDNAERDASVSFFAVDLAVAKFLKGAPEKSGAFFSV